MSSELLKPGVNRQCQANRHCAMEGSSFAVPIVSVGRPDGRLTAGCEVCAVFTCGGCAKRDAMRLQFGDLEVFAWRLACPHCGSPLGDRSPRRAVLHSAHFGPLATLDTSLVPWRLENESALDAVKEAVARHDNSALRLLDIFDTQTSVGECIRLSEMAVEESPGEGVAWLYVALLCSQAGYPIASFQARKELALLVNDRDIQRPGLPALRHLNFKPGDGPPDEARLEDLSMRLADYEKTIQTAEGRSLLEEATRVRLIARLLNFCRSSAGATGREPSAPEPAPEEPAKELKAIAEKPRQSFWQRLISKLPKL